MPDIIGGDNGATEDPVEPCPHEAISVDMEARQEQGGRAVRFSMKCGTCEKPFLLGPKFIVAPDRKSILFAIEVEGEASRIVIPSGIDTKQIKGFPG